MQTLFTIFIHQMYFFWWGGILLLEIVFWYSAYSTGRRDAACRLFWHIPSIFTPPSSLYFRVTLENGIVPVISLEAFRSAAFASTQDTSYMCNLLKHFEQILESLLLYFLYLERNLYKKFPDGSFLWDFYLRPKEPAAFRSAATAQNIPRNQASGKFLI